jgi:hypothetical protein
LPVIAIVYVVVSPIIITIFLKLNKNSLLNQDFFHKYGVLYEDIKPSHKYSTILPSIYLIKILLFSVSAVLL